MLTKFIINLTVFFIITSKAFSLPAILKVQLAEAWFKTFDKYQKKEKQEFILGLLFEDISLLEKIEHEKKSSGESHLKAVFEEKDPFHAGELFSKYFNYKREAILRKWGVKEKIAPLESLSQDFFLELLEDEISFSPLLCSKASNYLSAISEKELTSSYSVEKLAMWHGVMYKYFSQKPSSFVLSLSKDKRIALSFSEEKAELLHAALLFYASQEKFRQYVVDLSFEIEESFEFFKLKYIK